MGAVILFKGTRSLQTEGFWSCIDKSNQHLHYSCSAWLQITVTECLQGLQSSGKPRKVRGLSHKGMEGRIVGTYFIELREAEDWCDHLVTSVEEEMKPNNKQKGHIFYTQVISYYFEFLSSRDLNVIPL